MSSVPEADGYVYMNVGFASMPVSEADDYVYMNVGFAAQPVPSANNYVYIDVLTPPPFVGWGLPL